MPLEYTVTYTTTNHYQDGVHKADWQFLILPENNADQELISSYYENSLGADHQFSVNGYGFQTLRIRCVHKFTEFALKATFKVLKNDINPFDFNTFNSPEKEYAIRNSLDFKIDFEPFLKRTKFTTLPPENETIFLFDDTQSIFTNLQKLNTWVSEFIHFKAGVTHVDTELHELFLKRQGVCQDYAHLFSAISRQNGIPVRYVSGYLHQGLGYFGDSQMHAWVEAYVPLVGWIGFDPTNRILASSDHLKIAHGKDYNDCAPLKGVIYGIGKNETKHSVQVIAQQ
ncbi:transglutaminase family protein [Arenibacter sp. GZD96]|uniref:transglutaminase-like domain-containing protein n=1 Tax=Aurantibrevibacter litoralis TaxID=3106030 RepID=UPI002AFFA06A|nr:transglutaminase family protein [Arenibacter sp. GZD-96]MEA1786289.1 transglutaminase family protein [Arenibacter sp. GZD-96]